MRSLLSLELRFLYGPAGESLYVPFKSWEGSLLRNSDLSLATVNRAVDLLKLEHGAGIHLSHIPISGFTRSPSWIFDPVKRWDQRIFAYVGCLGRWHSRKTLESVLDRLSAALPSSKKVIVSGNVSRRSRSGGTAVLREEWAGMPALYDTFLGLVVPGGGAKDVGFMSRLLFNINLFSVKAAEALSLGVPIIVNSEIGELTDLVRRYRCGIVFDHDRATGAVSFRDVTDQELGNRDFWIGLSENAFKIGTSFERSRVLKLFQDHWSDLCRS